MKLTEKLNSKSKEIACLALIRNYIITEKQRVKEVILASKADKSKSFDKIFLMLYMNCFDDITQVDQNYVNNIIVLNKSL